MKKFKSIKETEKYINEYVRISNETMDKSIKEADDIIKNLNNIVDDFLKSQNPSSIYMRKCKKCKCSINIKTQEKDKDWYIINDGIHCMSCMRECKINNIVENNFFKKLLRKII